MFDLLHNAGHFAIPLGVFLFISIFVSIDRLFALREDKLGTSGLENFLLSGKLVTLSHGHGGDKKRTVFEKIVLFHQKYSPEAEEIRAYSEFELSKLERGLFLLNIVISAAPLVGLLGTVSGLMGVFSCFVSGTEMSNESLANGIALALSTTALGLIIAVPTIIVNDTINRKLDKTQAAINILIERLVGSEQMTHDASKK